MGVVDRDTRRETEGNYGLAIANKWKDGVLVLEGKLKVGVERKFKADCNQWFCCLFG